ncbi:MAG TPA: hypothetical protein VGM88_12410 [Kofleriaceae bacterium]|jgi:mono/diheme cytochrome c family protein
MIGGNHTYRLPGAPLMSRKAMLETLFRHLSMVRLSVAAGAMIALMGCTGLIDDGAGGGDDGDSDALTAAKSAWQNEALPVFRTVCTTCHTGTYPEVAFLAGSTDLDIRTTILGSPEINLDAVPSSRILTKNSHEGPPLTADQATKLTDWLMKEKAAVPAGSGSGITLDTDPFIVQSCTTGSAGDATCPVNIVALDSLGLAGAKIQFVAPFVGSILYLTDFQIFAGTDGLYAEHMLVVSHPSGSDMPVPDPLDRYFAMKEDLMANGSDNIGDGTAAFSTFSVGDKLSFHFKVLTPYVDASGSGSGSGSGVDDGGCKDLTTFKASAQSFFATQLTGEAQSCVSCHGGGNATAKQTLDMTGVDSTDDTTIATACAQIKADANLDDPPSSAFFLAPAPGNMNHPFHLTAGDLSNFKTQATVWINAEKVAP